MTEKLTYYLNLPWTYHFEWSNDDNCYIVSVAELKGCKSEGATIQDAAEMIKDALCSHLSACIEAGIAIPEPLKPSDYKGKIPYRTTPDTHYKLAQKSAVTGKSINEIINEAVKRSLKESA